MTDRLRAQLNKLAKWRTVFAGWQLGTRADTDPECQAVKDQREMLLLMRVELNAITKLLIDAKVGGFTVDQFQRVMLDEAKVLDEALEQRFPGFKTAEYGLDIDAKLAAETTRGWRP